MFVSGVGDGGFYAGEERANIVDFTVYPWARRMFVVEHFSGGRLKFDPVRLSHAGIVSLY